MARALTTVPDALALYARGYFPMAHQDARGRTRIDWLQPHTRGLIPLDERFHVSRSLSRTLRQRRFIFTTDAASGDVIRACAAPAPTREETWLCPSIIALFEDLFAAGHAHSIEAWLVNPDGSHTLVGGTYGLALGGVWCGESMFSRPDLGGTDASKACLVVLVERLRHLGFALFDAQMSNPHLEQFGLYEMPRPDYLNHLALAIAAPVAPWGPPGEISIHSGLSS